MHKTFARADTPRGERKLPAQDRRIEVHVTHGPDGKRQVVLQDLSHGPGVGWYVQKTVRLDREQVDALLASLCCVRRDSGSREPAAAGARILQIERLPRS